MPKPLFINIDGDALALDLAGPYKVRGRDMDLDDYKYITVAAYKCPKEYMDNKAFESVAKEFSMDEYEPSDVEDEYGMLEEEKGGVGLASGGEDEEVGEPERPMDGLRSASQCILLDL